MKRPLHILAEDTSDRMREMVKGVYKHTTAGPDVKYRGQVRDRELLDA
jgi:hypothetical protein